MKFRAWYFVAAVLTMGSIQGLSFKNSPTNPSKIADPQRRAVLQLVPFLLLEYPQISHAAMMENKQTVFKEGQSLSIEEAKARFRQAQISLNDLIQNYDTISAEGGGDNVRRYLGTVGTTSGLYGIQKVLRILQEEATDIVEYTESLSDFEYYLSAADTAAYSAIFVEFSSAKTKPEQFFADANKDVHQMRIFMNRMAQELSL